MCVCVCVGAGLRRPTTAAEATDRALGRGRTPQVSKLLVSGRTLRTDTFPKKVWVRSLFVFLFFLFSYSWHRV